MKIVHTEASCGWGGQEIRILEESRGMASRGHDVSLLCPAEARIFTEAKRFGVCAHALPIGRKRPAGVLALRRWFDEQQPDIVNTHSSTDSWLAGLACATLATPPGIVRTRHISAPVAVNMGSRWLYGRSAQHVVTTGEALRRTLIDTLDLTPEHLTSVPTGIDITRFAPSDKRATRLALGLDPDSRYIGIVATLRSWKGHTYLLEAFSQLTLPDWRMVIVGEGPQLEALKRRITELALDARVLLVGQKDNPEDWMRALDIFCLPSYANEGVPQSIMQAMLTGLPIITTPVGAILEAVTDGETAIVVAPKNTDQLSAALQTLCSDPRRAAALGSRSREQGIRRFSLERMLDDMEHIFHSVLRKNSRS